MNKINKHFSKIILTLLLLVFISSCSKDDTQVIENNENLLSIAKDNYNATFTANSLVQKQEPDWTKYIVSKHEEKVIIEVPFVSSNKNQKFILSASFENNNLTKSTLHRFIDTKNHIFPNSINQTEQFNGIHLQYHLQGQLKNGNLIENGKSVNEVKSVSNKQKLNNTNLVAARGFGDGNGPYDPYNDREIIRIDWYMLTYHTFTFPDGSQLFYDITNEFTHSEYIEVTRNLNGQYNEPEQIATNERTVDTTDGSKAIGPSCKSFNYQNTSSNWQEASVVNIRFNIVVIEIVAGIRVKKVIPITFPQPTRFGVPRRFVNGTVISSGLAAELSAKAIADSIDDVISRYNNLLTNSTDVIRSHFIERLKHNFRERTNGGRVNFNDMSSGLTSTQYKTFAFLSDNCD